MAQSLSRKTDRVGRSLYETDFASWIEEQVGFLRAGQFDALDVENVSEELESMGRSDRRGLRSHLAVIQAHLLKLRHQPEARSKSWLRSIVNSRSQIEQILDDSPSLRRELPAMLAASYPAAVRDAAIDTGLPRSAFPAEPPFTLDEVLERPIEEL